MKLIATYVHEDHVTTKNHGEFIRQFDVDEFDKPCVGFEFENADISWSKRIVTSVETVGDEVRIVVDWTI